MPRVNRTIINNSSLPRNDSHCRCNRLPVCETVVPHRGSANIGYCELNRVSKRREFALLILKSIIITPGTPSWPFQTSGVEISGTENVAGCLALDWPPAHWLRYRRQSTSKWAFPAIDRRRLASLETFGLMRIGSRKYLRRRYPFRLPLAATMYSRRQSLFPVQALRWQLKFVHAGTEGLLRMRQSRQLGVPHAYRLGRFHYRHLRVDIKSEARQRRWCTRAQLAGYLRGMTPFRRRYRSLFTRNYLIIPCCEIVAWQSA